MWNFVFGNKAQFALSLLAEVQRSKVARLYLYNGTVNAYEYTVVLNLVTYCRVDRNGTGASRPRGSRARDFINFRGGNPYIACAGRARAGLTVYPPWIQIRDVAATGSQSCDRKSKFGLRQGIKLN